MALTTTGLTGIKQQSRDVALHRELVAAGTLAGASGTLSVQLTNGNVITGTIDTTHLPAAALITDSDSVSWIVPLHEIVALGQ